MTYDTTESAGELSARRRATWRNGFGPLVEDFQKLSTDR
jgi:hypothetical protein